MLVLQCSGTERWCSWNYAGHAGAVEVAFDFRCFLSSEAIGVDSSGVLTEESQVCSSHISHDLFSPI